MLSNKEKFNQFCKQNLDIPLFLTYKWYNALFGDNWDVVLAQKNDNILGFLPYTITKKKTFQLIRPPFITPYQGIWMSYPEDQKYTNRLSFEKEVITDIIKQLPQFDTFQQKFLPDFTNWLPFYWNGFEQTTRYTYIIEDLVDTEKVFKDFKENIRREIRKAEKTLAIQNIDDISLLFDLKVNVYSESGDSYTIPKQLLINAFNFCKTNKTGELLVAKDSDGNIHSILFYVWDKTTAYYLHGGTYNNYKTSGSMSLLLWEAIKRSSKIVKQFNFEGSMVESIERYFRAFGGKQVPYFEIKKTDSKLLKLLKH